MTQQTINIGTTPNDGTGDPGREAFDKVNDNFTELYNVTDTALQSDGSVDGTDQLFTGHLAVGDRASVTSAVLVDVDEYFTDSAGFQNFAGMNFNTRTQGTSGFGSTIVGLQAVVGNSHIATTYGNGTVTGMSASAGHTSTSALIKLTGQVISFSTGTSSGTVTDAYGLQINTTLHNGTVTASYGASIGDVAGGPGAVTTATGLEITKQTGDTNSYGLVLKGNGVGADIVFGGSKEIRQAYDGSYLDFTGSGIAYTAQADTAVTGYVTISIDGTPRKFAIIDP